MRIENQDTDMLSETRYAPRKVVEQKISCPACGNEVKLEIYQHDTPVEGTVLILVANCPRCGYRYREVVPAQIKDKGVEIEIDVNTEESLKTVIYRSPYAHVLIPELSVEIVPGPANPGEITTVEGLLLYIAENVYPLCDTMDDPLKCYDIVTSLVNAANGEKPLKVVIRDPSGLSLVIRGMGKHVTIKELEKGGVEEEGMQVRIVVGKQTTQP